MKKLFFIGVSILFIIMGVMLDNQMAIFEMLVFPFRLIGDGLRELSLLNSFTNFLSYILFIIITLIPIYFLIFLYYKKKISKYDIVFNIILTVFLGLTIYYAINPFQVFTLFDENLISAFTLEDIYNFETIYLYGYASLIYITLVLYMIVKLKVSNYKNVELIFSIIVDIIILIFLISTLTIDLSATINSIQTESNSYMNFYSIIGFLWNSLIIGIAIYMIIIFRKVMAEIIGNSIEKVSVSQANLLSKISFSLLVIILLKSVFMTIYQLVFTKQLQNVFFNLNIPLGIILLTLSMYILSVYIKRVNQLNEEHSLII